MDDEKEIQELKELVSYIKGERKSDLALRGELINMMVDLCKVNNFKTIIGVADDIGRDDIEECLLDFMDMKFNIMIEDNSAKEIANALVKIRQ